MGNHRSVRAGSGWSGWRRAAIVGVGVGFAYATVGVVGLASGTTSPTPSVYSAIAPVTVLGRSLAAHSNTDVTVAGVGSVPSNATSVQLSVTALSGTTTSSMYVYPTGATQPTSANVRWTTGEVVTIPVTVAVGTAGKIRLTTDGGTVTVKVAVVGYFTPVSAPGGTGYGDANNLVSVPSATDGGATIASITVPAGAYEVQGKAFMVLDGGTADTVSCYLVGTTGVVFDSSEATVETNNSPTTLSLLGFDTTTAGGTLAIRCSDLLSRIEADGITLGAVQLSSATSNILGS